MCNTPILVSLDEQDTDRILRVLYNGIRPAKVHTLVCACGALADLRTSPKAWNGWQILPFARCPICLLIPPATNANAGEIFGEWSLRIFKLKLEQLSGNGDLHE